MARKYLSIWSHESTDMTLLQYWKTGRWYVDIHLR